MIRITEIYDSIEGEGIEIGTPSTFIRFAGCPLKCRTCDTKYSWNRGEKHTIPEIISKVTQKRVVITGGEPLYQSRELSRLLSRLLNNYVVLETSGVYYDEEIFSKVDFISADLKTPSSGLSPDLLERNLKVLHKICSWSKNVQVKAVCSDKIDLKYVTECFKELSFYGKPLVITPCWEKRFNKRFVQKIVKTVLENRINCRIIVQQHKLIFGLNKTECTERTNPPEYIILGEDDSLI